MEDFIKVLKLLDEKSRTYEEIEEELSEIIELRLLIRQMIDQYCVSVSKGVYRITPLGERVLRS